MYEWVRRAADAVVVLRISPTREVLIYVRSYPGSRGGGEAKPRSLKMPKQPYYRTSATDLAASSHL
jgi:hypothetical protein